MIEGTPFTLAQIIERLDNPERFRWSVHGIGMLRTYLDAQQNWRMNVWHPCLLNPGISTMHTHPWPFTSRIIAGILQNVRWDRCTRNSVGALLFNEGKITCGTHVKGTTNDDSGTVFPGLNGPPEVVTLHPRRAETYRPGESYVQQPYEIHDTSAQPGTITLIERGEMIPGCEASVFWPVGEAWGDASRQFAWADAYRAIADAKMQINLNGE